jgi:hypothetical protein
VRDQVSHPYKTTGKILVLYILISIAMQVNLSFGYLTLLYELNGI